MYYGGLVIVCNYATLVTGPTPPPGEYFMITESGGNLMTDESGNLMITE